MAELFGTSLTDPRVTIVETDVSDAIRAKPSAYDAVLLDVDNGPDGLTRKANDRIYGLQGLAEARSALAPGGVLAVWSSGPDAAFSARLRRSGFEVDEIKVRAHRGRSGAKHVIWIATRPGR